MNCRIFPDIEAHIPPESKLKQILTYALALFCVLSSPAQNSFTNRLFRSFPPDQLPSPFVRAIHQDKAGFIWLGTRAGLCRFDGQNYLRYTHEPGNPNSLANHHIRSILEDKNGRLWLSTFGAGLSCFDPASGQFDNFPLPQNSPAGRVHDALADRNENLWLATEGGGLLQFLRKQKRYRFIHFPPGVRDAFRDLRCISPGKNGSFWVGGTKGLLFQFFPETMRYRRISGIPLTSIWEIIPLSDTVLALGTINGLLSLNLQNGTVRTLADVHTKPALPGNIILAMCRDSYGKLWLGTSNGLAIYEPKTGRIETLKAQPDLPHCLPDERIVSLMQDRHGLMWVGTWNEGITHTPVQETGFHFTETEPGTPAENRLENVQKICWDRNGLLLASTWRGLVQLDTKAKFIRKYLADSSRPGLLPTNRLWGILSDSKNRLWVGTHYEGLYCREKPVGPLLKVDTLPGMRSRLGFSSEIFEDRSGRIWVGTYMQGLALWDEQKRNFRLIQLKTADGQALSGLNQINVIRQDPDGMLWLGTNGGGLVRFNPDNLQYRQLPPNLDKGGGFNGFVLGIAFTGNTLWISTEGGGVLYSSLHKPDSFTSLNRQTGLRDQNLPAIQSDAKGNLWLGGAGIYQVETASRRPEEIKSVKTYQSENLMLPQRWQWAALSADGQLAFGGNRAVLYFHPDQLHLPGTPEESLTGFTGLTGFGKQMPDDSALHEKRHFRIPAATDFFSLKLACLNFFGQDKCQLIYQLEGVHPTPVLAGASAQIPVSGLQPGVHAFRFRARNEAGMESPQQTIWFEKLPHWWQTIWFRLLCIFFILSLLYILFRWRLSLAKKQSEEKSRAALEKLELEVKALRSQMNPHFMFNALNAIDHFIWKNNPQQASEYLARFSRLMRRILEQSRQEYILLSEELESLSRYIELEQMRMDHAFDVEIRNEISEDDTMIAPMLLQPLVENAILHGLRPLNASGGRIQILIWQTAPGGMLHFSVEDNGVGRRPAGREDVQRPDGLGLSITRERILHLNAGRADAFRMTDLTDSSGKACGTHVEFSLPTVGANNNYMKNMQL